MVQVVKWQQRQPNMPGFDSCVHEPITNVLPACIITQSQEQYSCQKPSLLFYPIKSSLGSSVYKIQLPALFKQDNKNLIHVLRKYTWVDVICLTHCHGDNIQKSYQQIFIFVGNGIEYDNLSLDVEQNTIQVSTALITRLHLLWPYQQTNKPHYLHCHPECLQFTEDKLSIHCMPEMA